MAALLAALVGATYWNSFPGEFHFDDYPLLLDDPRVVDAPFNYGWFPELYGGRPLTLFFFHWSFRLFGENPLGYQLVSVSLHIVATVCLFFLISEWNNHVQRSREKETQSPFLSHQSLPFCAGLIFGLHPLQSQAVNYIWSQSMLWMTVFSMAALLLRSRVPWLSLAAMQLAILSRTEAVLLAPLLVMRDRTRWKWPLFLAAINTAAFFASMVKHSPDRVGWNHPSPMEFYLSQPLALLEYFRLMVLPTDLHIDRDFAAPYVVYSWIGAASIAALIAAAWTQRRRRPILAMGSFWVCLWLLPSMLIPNTELVSESRAYLAMAGFACIAASAVAYLGNFLMQTSRVPLLTGVLAFGMISATMARNQLWKNEVALLQDAAEKSPRKARVRYNLGSALARKGRVEEAAREFQLAVELSPEDDLSYSALGYCAEVQQKWLEAEHLYEKALKLNADNKRAAEGISRLAARREEDF